MWELLAFRDCLVQNVEWTSPNMKIMELLLLSPRLGQEIIWAKSSGGIWSLVVEIGSILDCQWPQEGLETSGQCMAEWSIIVLAMDMMVGIAFSATPCDVHQLQQIIEFGRNLLEMGCIGLGGEGCTIVRDVLQRDDSSILVFQLKVLFGLESLMSVEMLLKYILNSFGAHAYEECSSSVHVGILSFSS